MKLKEIKLKETKIKETKFNFMSGSRKLKY